MDPCMKSFYLTNMHIFFSFFDKNMHIFFLPCRYKKKFIIKRKSYIYKRRVNHTQIREEMWKSHGTRAWRSSNLFLTCFSLLSLLCMVTPLSLLDQSQVENWHGKIWYFVKKKLTVLYLLKTSLIFFIIENFQCFCK